MTPFLAQQPHLSQIQSVLKHFACDIVFSAQELFAIEKMAVAGMGNKKIPTTPSLPPWATTWCGGSCVSCFPCISRLTSLELCVICAFVLCCLMIKSGACSCRIIDQRLGCHRAVLFSRQCSHRAAKRHSAKTRHFHVITHATARYTDTDSTTDTNNTCFPEMGSF